MTGGELTFAFANLDIDSQDPASLCANWSECADIGVLSLATPAGDIENDGATISFDGNSLKIELGWDTTYDSGTTFTLVLQDNLFGLSGPAGQNAKVRGNSYTDSSESNRIERSDEWWISPREVNWHFSSGAGAAPIQKIYLTDSALTGGYATAPDPYRPGYTFNYWCDSGNCGPQYQPGDHFTTNEFSSIISADMTPNDYTVSYDSTGGSSAASTVYTFDSAIALATAPTWAGHTFNGWFTQSTGGTQILNGNTPQTASDFTLYAQWTADASPAPAPAPSETGSAALSYTGSQTDPMFLIGGSALTAGLGMLALRLANRRRKRG